MFVKISEIIIYNIDVVRLVDISYMEIGGINILTKIISIRYKREKISEIENIFQSKLLRASISWELEKESELDKLLR